MAHYSFHKDLEHSQEAVRAVKYDYESCGCIVRDITTKEEQLRGDLAWRYPDDKEDDEEFVEVKYDIMSGKTGNLCFEIFNGAGRPTGILRTTADQIIYVLDSDNGYTLFSFNANELRSWIFNPENHTKVRLVSGGDGGRYKMLLIKKENIEVIADITEVSHAEL